AKTDETVSVLFEIDIDLSLHNITFADISRTSEFAPEKEVLFDIDRTVELESLTFDIAKDRWIIQLATSNYGADLTQVFIEYQNEESSSTLSTGILLGCLFTC
ncbi:unnamed protein product, partial [Didymodactylos carnosus]